MPSLWKQVRAIFRSEAIQVQIQEDLELFVITRGWAGRWSVSVFLNLVSEGGKLCLDLRRYLLVLVLLRQAMLFLVISRVSSFSQEGPVLVRKLKFLHYLTSKQVSE